MTALSLLVLWLGTWQPAIAGAGHDHDHGHAAPVAAGPAAPRFAAVSEAFELVGVLDGRQITLYLDRAADNAPVTGARIELEVAGTALTVTPQEDRYELVLAAAPPPGVLAITATVTAGNETDLLAAELEVPATMPADDTAHHHGWPAYAGWAAAAGAGLVALLLIGRRLASRQRPDGAAA